MQKVKMATTYGPIGVDVKMVDLGLEADFGRFERIVWREGD
jgi:hypothetical protein